jgi:hypothetical protein
MVHLLLYLVCIQLLMASPSACCEALTELRFRHLDQHFMKLGDFEDISVCRAAEFLG